MNAFQIGVVLAVVAALAATSTSVTVPTQPKMTWEDVFRDRIEVKDLTRRPRSHFSTKKSFVLSHAYESDLDQPQYSLQNLDQFAGGHYYSQDDGKESLLLALKNAKQHSYETIKSTSLKTPLSFVYTESQQEPQHPETTYKFVTVPSTSSNAASSYHKVYDDEENTHDDHYASNYKFGYRVSDPHTGAEFGHSEVSEGHTKKGHYHVLLPDGRLQNVKYWADPSGYHATVTYEGHGYHYPTYH